MVLLLGFRAIFGGVYKGSFRIDFFFLGIFSEVLGIFLC